MTAGNSGSVALKRILAGYEIFSADNENLILVTKRRSRVRVGTEAPQSNPSCPTAPTDLPLPGALDLGLGGRFWSRKIGFYSVEAGTPLTIFVRQITKILIPVTKRRSRVRVGTEAPQSNPSCPATPTNPPLPGAVDLGLGGGFCTYYFVGGNVAAWHTHDQMAEPNFPAEP